MGGNRLKWLVGGLFAFFVIVAVINRGSDTPKPPPADSGAQSPVGPEEPASEDGPAQTADSDTMTETLKTVQAQYGEQRRTNQALQEELASLQKQLATLQEQSQDATNADEQSVLAQRVAQLQDVVNEIKASGTKGETGLPGLGFDSSFPEGDYQVGDGGADYWTQSEKEDADGTQPPGRARLPGYVRLSPLTRRVSRVADGEGNPDGSADTLGLEAASDTPRNSSRSSLNGDWLGTATPLATIPARSTAFDATAMTALIGRVPVSGQVVDPFPVKIILGDDNLAANGHRIPGLRGIILDGVARGDWTMGCVSVELTGGTYVFDDGTISHLNGTTGVDDSVEQGAASLYGNESGDSIGYITDVQGTPCIAGTKITDAYKQAGIATVIGGLQGYAQYRADAERTTTTGAGSGVVVDRVSGDKSAFSQYGLAATGLEKTLEIIQERFQDTFDAIYVPPGRKVAVHFARDLHIVHHTSASKIVYDQDLGGAHAFD